VDTARWRGPATRRSLLAVVLVAAALIPGRAISQSATGCSANCAGPGTVRWAKPLPGTWVARTGIAGTVPAHGETYAAAGAQLAAVGFGTTVAAFATGNGEPRWTATLTGLPPGASIVAVRVWDGTVTAGVSFRGGRARTEVVLSSQTGRQVRQYPAAPYGGAVASSAKATVIVGNRAVTSYDNRTGRARWRRHTGQVAQAWRVDGEQVYVTEAKGGYLGTAPVTALRRISLRTGTQQVVRPTDGGPFAGTLAGAFEGVVLFSGRAGLTAYDGATGQQLWNRRSALPAGTDAVSGTLYLTANNALTGVNPRTGGRVAELTLPGSASLYGIRAGVALGLDLGAHGDAWGYRVARRRVVWTTTPLPWPHYFVDLSGVGGSAGPASRTVLLTTCAQLGDGTSAQKACPRPELVAVTR
jgi:hypothetical protein